MMNGKNMKLSTLPYKGARDFYPEQLRRQKYIFSIWRKVVESYGYEEYNAPILESSDLYYAKSGQEIVNEQTYNFEDRGGRKITIRPEMTPSVSRMVASRRQQLSYPLRLYSIPNLWRYERPQKGRLREHWQLNVDIFGIEAIEADIEMILISRDIMRSFGAKDSMYEIKVNSRKLTNLIMKDFLRLDSIQSNLLIKLLDKLHKIPRKEFDSFANEIIDNDQDKFIKLSHVLKNSSFASLPEQLARSTEASKIKEFLTKLELKGINNVTFDVSLMRGFDYYTDLVFEINDTNPENNRAMFGGGRYDGLVGLFGVDPVPTVGFGMGDVVISDFLDTHKLSPKLRIETDIYIITIGDYINEVDKIAQILRKEGVNVAIDYSKKKIDKQLKTAFSKKILFVMFVGDKEISEGKYNLKNMQTSKEEKHSIERIISIVKDHRIN